MEGQCHSGEHADCHGSGNLITCCHGHLGGQDVGPTEVNTNNCLYDTMKLPQCRNVHGIMRDMGLS